jgi:luciferase family oxidoreductase group 1
VVLFSVLEQAPGLADWPDGAAIGEALAFGRHCEGLGFHRFWFAEQHNNRSMLSSAPEILTAALAQATTRLRVGAGAIQLPHYAPLKVAEQFRCLAAIAPGRIDLGLGRSPGDAHVERALRRQAEVGEFEASIANLLALLRGDAVDALHAYPRGENGPNPWIMASSTRGARVAARFGLPMCFNHSDYPDAAEAAIGAYRAAFVPDALGSVPRVMVLVWTLCAPSGEEARHLFWTRIHWRHRLLQGERAGLIAPGHAREHLASADLSAIDAHHRSYVIDEPTRAAERINHIARRLGADEVLLLGWTYAPEAKRRSYELLAHALGLGAINLATAP